MLSEDEFAELTEALEGRNLQANWWATESFASDFSIRRKFFFWIFEHLLKEGRIKLAKHGKFLEGSVDEQVERFRRAFPKTEKRWKTVSGFLMRVARGELFGCLKMALSNGPDKPFIV